MSVTEMAWSSGRADGRVPDVDIVVPVFNETSQLEWSIRTLHRFVDREFPLKASLTIADNASTDGTWAKATDLAAELPSVRKIHLEEKGRGRALRAAWSTSEAPVVAYLDVDLSTDLDALFPLVASLVSGHSDVAIGTRLAPGARVVRGPVRELISRGYNRLVQLALRGGFSDAQCGFKALRRDVAVQLLPLVRDEEWFFDTELLVVAERLGFRIHEVPVDWVDDPDSRVDLVRTIRGDLLGVWRMLRHRAAAPAPLEPRPATSADLLRFAGVGVFSTLAYTAVFAVLWPLVGGYVANVVSVVGCGVANAAVHRRLAGGEMGGDRRRLLVENVVLIGVSLAVTSGALAAATASDRGSLFAAIVAVSVANATAALGRFWLLRTWVYKPTFRGVAEPAPVGRPTTALPSIASPLEPEQA